MPREDTPYMGDDALSDAMSGGEAIEASAYQRFPEEHEDERPVDVPIRSSAISHARYDPGAQSLTLTFRKGLQRHYTLSGVGPALFERFLKAPSKGRFFHEELRGQYG